MQKFYYFSRLFFIVSLFIFSENTIGQTKKQSSKITQSYDLSKLNTLQKKLSSKALIEKKQALNMAKLKNWPLIIKEKGSYAELQKVAKNGTPIYYTTFNVNAAKSTRTNFLNNGGGLGLNLEGQNMKAHVWDGGLARKTHQEYDGAGGNNRFSIGDGTTSTHYHSGHVTGTIIASGVQANAKGMAPKARAVGYDWNSDESEATTAATNGMLISNHSYGYRSDGIPDQWFGAYRDDAHDWDAIMYNAPYYLMVVAAGNDGNDNSSNGAPLDGNSSYDKLSGHATAKNNMVVANAQDASIDANGNLNSVSINSSSSEGPTDDYRIKPDITGNGTSVYSTYVSSDTAYNSITGTSMASPNVAGTLLLLQQHYNNLNNSFMRAATLKGLALHTADDAGPSGPDAVYGWGLLNAKAAAEAITNNGTQSLISELTLSPGQTYTTTVTAAGAANLIASISWTDPAGVENSGTNSHTPALVNDLDIRVSNGTTYYPYKLTSITTNAKADNTVDPYEKVNIANASGDYTITITHKGSLSGGSQKYSLIVTGVTTAVSCTATTPTGLSTSNVSSTSAQVSWSAVANTTYDVRYKKVSDSNWTTTAVSATSTTLNGLTASTQYEAQVRSKCSDGTNSSYSSSVNFTTSSTQLNYCTSKGNSVHDEYIQKVQLGSINNSSGATSGYTDFTSISTDLSQGSNYTITITPKWTGTVYNEGYAVWIDYNNDGDFTDSGELVWSKAASKDTPVSGTFTVPTTASQTATRMRVSLKYNRIPTSCESFNYGEVEDYTVNITGGSTGGGCQDTTLSITFDNYPKETSWDIKDGNGTVVFSGGTYASEADGSTKTISMCIDEGCYTFTMKDSYGDGMCCSYGNGSYSFTKDSDGTVLASGASFTSTDATNFCLNSNSSNNYTNYEETAAVIADVTVYPNPVKDVLSFKLKDTKMNTYRIVNMMGQTIGSGKLPNANINVSQLKSGVYIIEFSSGKKMLSQRFIKQ